MPEGVGYQGLADAGGILSVAGLMLGAVGSFYAAQSQQYQLRSEALSLEHQSNIANLNARQAELDAQRITEAGQRDKGRLTLGFRQLKGSARASQAARGIQAGVGSAAEVQASIDFAKESDALTLATNTAAAAGATRIGATDLRNRALLARTSAANLRAGAGTISPGLAGATSLLGGAGRVASQFAASRRREVR